ncbi:TPA: group II intron maturase-specific domain-containing protein [Staphylococcus pseudintermedius]|uniref:group II intron maturase-specific domain-containing protein n=1 Tax=Staphylococcus pseudintermedius TaxID=283734 RepID=UPI001F5BF9EA|nr:group II intron maturase-specific domain-containing protein [Staphylococcus pseudintermedius]MDF0354904.1 hypothetical protein [Staphylococcus pseudintermedius]MDK4151701.1 hypothetical protein [Staphylococcus pseudintermedius]
MVIIELEKHVHRLVRYVDDFVIFVSSKRVRQRVMENMTKFTVKTFKFIVNTEINQVIRGWTNYFGRGIRGIIESMHS